MICKNERMKDRMMIELREPKIPKIPEPKIPKFPEPKFPKFPKFPKI